MLETAPEAVWGVHGRSLGRRVVTCTRGAQKPAWGLQQPSTTPPGW